MRYAQQLEEVFYSFFCFLYFLSRSRIASSIRTFWRKSNRAASIFISFRRLQSKVVLYIFLFFMLNLPSCRSIGNYTKNFNKKAILQSRLKFTRTGFTRDRSLIPYPNLYRAWVYTTARIRP